MRWVEVLWCGSLKDPTFAFYVGLSTPSLIRKRRSFPNTDLAKRCPRSRARARARAPPGRGQQDRSGSGFLFRPLQPHVLGQHSFLVGFARGSGRFCSRFLRPGVPKQIPGAL